MSKLLAIDYGTKRVGVAVSDGESTIAHKYDTLENRGDDSLSHVVAEIYEKEEIDLVVLGVPLSLSGGDSEMTKTVRSFAEKLKKLSLKVELFDERYTSKTALQNVPKEERDVESARVILQTYIDKQNARA